MFNAFDFFYKGIIKLSIIEMQLKIIADAGSTKTDWAILLKDGSLFRFTKTKGVNPLMESFDSMSYIFKSVKAELPNQAEISEIHFYGAGCATTQLCEKVQKSLNEIFKAKTISVESDLLGAARAVLQHEKGIAAILGTGSNSCLYDGQNIIMNTPALGFILGDEGGGAALGKRLIGDIFKDQLPSFIKEKFFHSFNINLNDILESIYRGKTPGAYLASFVPFILENIDSEDMQLLLSDEFTRFFKRNIFNYPGYETLRIGFVGSIAEVFEPQLKNVANNLGLRVGMIIKSPIYGLINYHNNN